MRTLGPWEIIRRLGAGGSAEVFLARPLAGGEEIALKVLLPHLADDPAHVSMLLREARAVGALSHPNIAALLQTGEVDGHTFLAMELVRGAPLVAVLRALRERRDTGEAISLSAAAYLVREAAKGLHHAHERELIHRDVSPHNLMVSATGEVKVVDFGLARATHDGATATGGLKGKLRYMPPEQVRTLPLDRRADVFALGAVLWELALGQPLYEGENEAEVFRQALVGPPVHPDELVWGLPRAFVDVLLKSVAADREKRTRTALKLAEALEPFIGPEAQQEWSQRVQGLSAEEPSRAEPSRQGDRPPIPTDPGLPAHVVAAPPRTAPPLQPMPKKRRGAAATPAPSPAEETRLAPDDEPSAVSEVSMPAPHGAKLPLPRLTSPEFRASRGRSIRRGIVIAVPIVAAVAMFVLDKLDLVILTERPAARTEAVDGPAPEREAELAVAVPEPVPLPVPVSAEEAAAAPTTKPVKGRTAASIIAGAKEAPARRPDSGTLVLTATSPAFVKAGPVDLGMTPVTAQLPAGKQTLELTSPDGTKRARLVVTVPRGGTVERRVTLQPR